MRVSRRDNLDRFYLLKLFGFGLFLHRIHHSEKLGVFHTHPWNGVSLILGHYWEQQHGTNILRKRWGFRFLSAQTPHRVEVRKPVWTVFLHGRRFNRWRVVDNAGNVLAIEPWRDTHNPEVTAYA
jgi:hypothetical protein